MIELRNVTKHYRLRGVTKPVIDEMSLTLPTGVNVAVLGRNGAGKSTLLRMIGGSMLPDRGEIVRHGRVSWPLGFAGGFHAALTGLQNTRFVGRIYGADTDELVAFVEDFAELGAFLDMPFSTYSSGMRARLAFGVSMGIAFDWYLVDEITAVGDAPFKRKCDEMFQTRLKNSQVIMVSHSNAQIRKFCDVAIILEQGSYRYFDNIEDGLAAYEDLVGV